MAAYTGSNGPSSSLGTSSPAALTPGSAPALTLVDGTGATGAPGTRTIRAAVGPRRGKSPPRALRHTHAEQSPRRAARGSPRWHPDRARVARDVIQPHARSTALRSIAGGRDCAAGQDFAAGRSCVAKHSCAGSLRHDGARRREALERRRLTAPKPPVTPAPVRAPHRKLAPPRPPGQLVSRLKPKPLRHRKEQTENSHPPQGTGTSATGSGQQARDRRDRYRYRRWENRYGKNRLRYRRRENGYRRQRGQGKESVKNRRGKPAVLSGKTGQGPAQETRNWRKKTGAGPQGETASGAAAKRRHGEHAARTPASEKPLVEEEQLPNL